MKTLYPLLVATIMAASTAGFAASITSTASGGDWNASSTWASNKVPAAADDVTILAGASVTVTANASIHTVTFANAGSSTAILTVNSGVTLTVAQTITSQNAAAMNTSALIQGGGTINCVGVNVGGTTTPTPAGSDYTATLTSTISNLVLSGSLSIKALYNPAPAAANQGTFALGSGSVSVDSVAFTTVPFFGPILTLATGDQNGTLTLAANNPFSSTGSGSSTFIPNGTNATVIYAGNNTQPVYAATYQNLTLAGAANKGMTGVTVIGTLSMQGKTRATLAPTYGPNAVLEYKGSIAQTTGPELTAAIPNLTINNANGVTLARSTTVGQVLTLANGNVITGTNQIVVDTNGSVSGGSSSSYVNGNVQKNFSAGTQSFIFPIGSTEFAPVSLSNLGVIAPGAIAASTTAGAPAQIGSSGIITNQNVNRYWVLTSPGGTFGTYSAGFNYPAADVDAGAVAAGFGVSVLNGGVWSLAAVSGTPTSNLTSISGQSGFGTFVIGDLLVSPAANLAVTSVNGGVSPVVGASFSVTVQAQDTNGAPHNVIVDTGITLSLNSGSGILGGTLAGTIAAGSSSVTISGVTYSVAQSGVQVAASSTSGQSLATGTSAAFTVSAANQSITFPSPGAQTYGVAPITLTATASSGLPVSYSILSGPAMVSGNTLTLTGAGSVTIQASQAGNANWNAATPVSRTISVAAKTVVGSFIANNKVYDGTPTASLASLSLNGIINSDNVSLGAAAAAFGDKNVGNGKTVIASGLSLGGSNAGNYVLASTYATNTANITAATLTVTANNTNRAYGAANPAFTANYSGFMNGDDASVLSGAPALTTTATASSSVAGSPYPITAAQGTLSAANYSFSFANGELTVTPATLTVTANNTNRAYGAANPAFTASFSGFVNGDDASVLSGAPALTTTATASSSVVGSPYPITAAQGTLSAANYSFSFVNGNLSVSAATLTVTANNTNRAYGAANPAFAASFSGFVNGDDASVLSGAPSLTTTATASSSVVGSPYPITAAQGTLDAANYSFSFVNGNLSVTAATLTVTANNTNRAYGAANPAFTASFSGFVNGDDASVLSGAPSLTTAANASSSVAGSPYAITAGQGTLSAANYSFSFVNGNLSVTAAALMVTANNTNRAYGALNPAFTASYSGFVNGEDMSVLSGAPSLTTAANASSSVAGSPYLITAGQGTLSAANYSFNFASGSLTVTPAALTVTANDTNRTYGASNPAFTPSYSGFVNGEDTGVLSGAPSLTTTATASSSVAGSPYPITAAQGTLSAANYSFSFANGELTVTPATLTVTANNTNRAYGAANPAFTAGYSGFVNGEDMSVLSGAPALTTTAAASSSVAGSPYPITAAQGTLSAANYSFSFVNGNLSVTAAALMVTANNTNRAYGALNPAFTASYSGFVNGEDMSVLSGAPSLTTTATASSSVAGSPYLITAGQGTLSAANYSFNFASGSLAVTPAALTVTANDTNRTYGASNPAFTPSYSGFVNGEDTGVLSGAPSLTTTATASSSVAGSPYPITAAQGTLSAANYSFSFGSGNLSITPAALTLTADNKSRPYGTTNPVLTASYSGFVNGEDTNVLSGSPSLSTTADTNSPPGAYAIQVGVGTLISTNYSFDLVDGTLTVSSLPATLTIRHVGGSTNAVILDATGVAPSATYHVIASTNLHDWTEIGTAQSSAGGAMSFTNNVSEPAQFYRVYGP